MDVVQKVRPKCGVCKKPFQKDDQVYTDTIFSSILHVDCFFYNKDCIEEKGTYEEIVEKYSNYKRIFIVE